MTYSRKDLAQSAATSALGGGAKLGRHFYLKRTRTQRWFWAKLPPGRSYPWQGKFAGRAEVNEYLSGDEVTCLLCGAPYVHLPKHLQAAHRVVTAEYKLRFGIPQKRALVGPQFRAAVAAAAARVSADPVRRAARDERFKTIKRGVKATYPAPAWCRAESLKKWRAGLQRWLLRQSIEHERIDGRAILDRARKALPMALPPDMREEIAQEIAVAVVSGTLPVSLIERQAKDFIVSFNRANRGKYGDLSLDAPLYGEGHVTLGDRITSETFHF